MRVPLQLEDVMVGHISKYCRKELVQADSAAGLFQKVFYFKGWDGEGKGQEKFVQSFTA